MEECEFITKCPFFKGDLSLAEEKVEETKKLYCSQNSLHCARYMVANALGKETVPGDLLPFEKNRAYMIIAENT